MAVILEDEELNDAQLGSHMQIYTDEFPDLKWRSKVVLLAVAEERGTGNGVGESDSPDIIRKHLYNLYYWHPDIRLADVGTILPGASLNDLPCGCQTVIAELINQKNSSDHFRRKSWCYTGAQYRAYVHHNQVIEASCIDSFINLGTGTSLRSENFLMEMLTGEPNFIRHYNHLAFQSYFVHPNMLQTMDKLHFDCFRVGVVKEHLEEMEPVIRNSNLLSIDMAAMAHSFAPANRTTLTILNGEDICNNSTRYADWVIILNTMGILDIIPKNDVNELTAIQIAQMIWYFIDGRSKGKTEARLSDRKCL